MRKYYDDWLRVGGILWLFPFHAARIFDFNEPNYIQDTPNVLTSWFIISSAFWFMPLLFLLAGIASFYALEKRSPLEYVKERFYRLFIPFVFGMFIIVPPQGYFAKLQHFSYTGSYFEYIKGYFYDFSDLSGYRGTFTPAHLWFILFLFIISLLLLPAVRSIKTHKKSEKIMLLQNPFWLLLLFVPLTLTEAIPAIGGKNIFYYGLFFLMGYGIASNEGTFETIKKMKLPVLLSSIVFIPAVLYLSYSWGWPQEINPKGIFICFLKNFVTWLWLIVLLGYGEKYLNFGNKVLSYLNRAAFPIYILHQTVMMGVAYYAVKLEWPFLWKFLFIIIITFVLCLLLYEGVKRFKAGRFILGIK